MDTSSTPTTIARRLVPALAVALTVLVPACGKPPTQIVLVVDTNLGKAELDEVKITVGAPADQVDASPADAAVETDAGQFFDTSLTDGVHAFPLTLGIVPSGSPGSLQVSVEGLLAGNVVVQQTVVTSFVPGQPKVLEVQLLDTCVGIACAEGTTSLTCRAGICQTRGVDGPTLPTWTGELPPPPEPSPTVPIGGRTIWANGWHTCAVSGARLYCWGRNSDGEIGDGMATNAKIAIPVYTSDLAAVGLGQKTTCVCDRAGQAWCWGRNVEAELGIGTASPSSPAPVAVPGLDDCAQIAGGALHTCAVHRTTGTVSCWGGNAEGQAGQPVSTTVSCAGSAGSTPACIKSPTLVPGLKDVAEVHAGESYTCARKTDMTVWCWGSNFNGTLGDGTNTSRSTPAAVVNLDKDVAEIATGRWFACARHAGGTVSCWGQNDTGQLGNQMTGDMNKPVAVLGINDAAQIGAGERHACVLHASGAVSCWGLNTNGQLGNGKLVNSPVPQDVLKSATSIAVGLIHTCAVLSTGSPVCWGANDAVEIGDGDSTKTPRPLPTSVAGFM